MTTDSPTPMEADSPVMSNNNNNNNTNNNSNSNSNNYNNNNEMAIDEDLHSRQLAVYGRHAMGKLSVARVLVSGLGGLGCEIAKNVILANVGSVTLQDTAEVQKADLASLFYAMEEDVGRNRAASVVQKLKELNPAVKVSECVEPVSKDLVGSHDVVVLTDAPQREALRVSEMCRAEGVKFIRADVRGVFGSIFTDFGVEHVVTDTTGEQIKTAIIASVSNTEKGIVTCVEDERIDFEDGDIVEFSEVKGMPELKDGVQMKIKNVRAHSFEIGDTTGWGEYISGGIATEVKQPKTLKFRPLSECLSSPGDFLESDFSKFGRSVLLHALFLTLDAYKEKHGRSPGPGSAKDGDLFVETLKAVVPTLAEASRPELDDAALKIARQFASGSRATLNPLCAIFGGIGAQEVIKSMTGKYHPIHQWFYYDCIEALSDDPLPEEDLQPINSRYDSQIMVFGRAFQKKLGALKYFMVGAGALGCEFVKNFAMMGIACGPDGKLTVTDDDTIERSNLTRQFLFRNWMIGKPKSSAAAEAVKPMNPELKFVAMQDRVSEKTEHTFDDAFWEGLDGVCNALDNMKARLYVDSRCVFFGKPLLESGTLGTKCNTQIVVPHKTENYGASRDPPEKQAPDCTLHNFPHTINHCLSWGRSEFIGNFETAPTDAAQFIESPNDFVATQESSGTTPLEILEKMKLLSALMEEPCRSFDDCISWARHVFEDYFSNRVKQLTHTFPRDAKTSSGLPFWSAPKRFPTPIVFDAADPVHGQFIAAAANLRAEVFGVERPAWNRDFAAVGRAAASVSVPPFKPKEGIKIKVNPNDPDPEQEDETSTRKQISDLLANIKSSPNFAGLKVTPLEFEKDDDTNFHMDFIGSVGNLRARSYEISEVDKLQAKLIAGRIIPAIATATALATGFVCLELLKVVQDKPIEQIRNTFANLALPLFAISEPMPPAKVSSRVDRKVPDPINHPDYVEEEEIIAYPEGHTVWDRITVELPRSATLQEVMDFFRTEHDLTMTSAAIATAQSAGVILYNAYIPSTANRTEMRFTEIIKSFGGEDVEGRKYIRPMFTFTRGDEDADVEIPELIYKFKD